MTVHPWYLILGRPYPLQVYQYACSYYSTNPEVGQRGAAEATRIKYNLETFSHSTVCRSYRAFEDIRIAILEKRYGEEVKINGTEGLTIVRAVPKTAVDKDLSFVTEQKPHSEKRFPSVMDTASRRKAMTGFLPNFQKGSKRTDIEAAGRQFAKDWHEKSRRLLL